MANPVSRRRRFSEAQLPQPGDSQPPLVDLTGQRALVTGASRGIGRAVAEILARAGADVAVHYHANEEAARRVVRKLKSGGRHAVALRADMGSAQDIWQMFDLYDNSFPALDICVCNAGVWKRTPIDTVSEEEVRAILSVNLEGVLHTCRMAAKRMIRQGSGGSIILVASTAGQRGEPFYSIYAASKGALIALAKSLAVELAPHRIRVNAVAPGWIATDMTRDALAGPEGDRVRAAIPVGEPGRPEDVAGAVLFLASGLARYVVGEVLSVNGGALLSG